MRVDGQQVNMASLLVVAAAIIATGLPPPSPKASSGGIQENPHGSTHLCRGAFGPAA
jgi:hypothetical protein